MYREFSKVYDKFMEYADYDGWHDFVSFIVEGNNPGAETILDLGCGTGEVLIRFAEDYRCTGVDLSEEMLSEAKNKTEKIGGKIPLFCQDMRQLNTGEKYDVIISLFDTVNHLISLEDLNSLFLRIREHLEEDGIYIFDVVDREFMEEMFPGGVFADQRADMTAIWEHDYDEDLDYVDATFFIKNENGLYEKYTENFVKKIFSHHEIKTIAEKTGLYISEVYEDDYLAGKRGFYVLKK